MIKNMPNKKKFEKMNFLLLLRTECICVWYHCFWYQMKVKLICDKATHSDQNNYPIKNYSTFCKGNKKWEI